MPKGKGLDTMDLKRLGSLLRSEKYSQTKLADGTGVLLNVDGLRVLTLNETGMFLVEEIQGGVDDLSTLVGRMATEFDVDDITAKKDVEGFLSELGDTLQARES
jgi:hypothetical protein